MMNSQPKFLRSGLVAAAFLLLTSVASAQSLKIDFGGGTGSSVASGFIDGAGADVTGQTLGGQNGVYVDFTSTISGTRNRQASSANINSNAVLNDFIFTSSASAPLQFTIGGLAANTSYNLTLWTVDTDFGNRTFSIWNETGATWNSATPSLVASGVTVGLSSGGNVTDSIGSTLDDSRWTTSVWLTSDAGGLIKIAIKDTSGGGVNVLNGLELAAIPEPSAFAAFAGLTALGLVAARRRRGIQR